MVTSSKRENHTPRRRTCKPSKQLCPGGCTTPSTDALHGRPARASGQAGSTQRTATGNWNLRGPQTHSTSILTAGLYPAMCLATLDTDTNRSLATGVNSAVADAGGGGAGGSSSPAAPPDASPVPSVPAAAFLPPPPFLPPPGCRWAARGGCVTSPTTSVSRECPASYSDWRWGLPCGVPTGRAHAAACTYTAGQQRLAVCTKRAVWILDSMRARATNEAVAVSHALRVAQPARPSPYKGQGPSTKGTRMSRRYRV